MERNTKEKIINVLDNTRKIIQHNEELAYAKGELFNIYNILNLKTDEVRTHSAFLGELLNPDGTHLMKDAFLKAFFKILPTEVYNDFNCDSATLKIEHYIDVVDNLKDIGCRSGGRIDIYLSDAAGNSISIENKIDAGDQLGQIERYCNYNKPKNKVLYLSKYGDEPSEESIGNLIAGEDYHIIAYNNEILNWLEDCQAIASDQPILRESIKQYKILIQQITNTLGNKLENELNDVIIKNLEEAAHIANNYNKLINKLKKRFRDQLAANLKSKLKDYKITDKRNVDQRSAALMLRKENLHKERLCFGIEGFSGIGHKDGVLFIGIYDKNEVLNLDKDFNKLTGCWPHFTELTFDEKKIYLSDFKFLQSLNDEKKLNEIVEKVSSQVATFIEANKVLLQGINSSSAN
ncbi:PD-(D/E)XK nuclease family protein [Formosa sp. A9]|uniref:PDDEXK-like family protein n=1 Tax=Formosa sp. A9 TaxID=3442641 RepID=UPI003EBA5B30